MKTSPEVAAGAPEPAYHDGSRRWQDRFDSRRLADRLDERLARSAFNAEDREFIGSQALFFLATADAQGRPDVSYKGGRPGFVRVIDERTLAFPSYDGNGMFLSLGNLSVNAEVGLLFIDFERPRRLRVLGCTTVAVDDALMADFAGAQAVVRVQVRRVFPNCPRYIHRMQRLELSEYVPAAGHVPPVPAWKRFEMFSDALPAGDAAACSDAAGQPVRRP